VTARFSVKISHIEDDLILVLKKQAPTVKVITVRLKLIHFLPFLLVEQNEGAVGRSPPAGIVRTISVQNSSTVRTISVQNSNTGRTISVQNSNTGRTISVQNISTVRTISVQNISQ
jgi:hypothetical protein